MAKIIKHDIVYFNGFENDNCLITSGIDFYEFSALLPLRNLLLLKHNFFDADFNLHLCLDYVEKEGIISLKDDKVHTYGDFCWIDFEETTYLDLLEPKEIAEILYISHLKAPISTPFFQKLNNKYVYLANDDGWMNKIYYRDMDDFKYLLRKIIPLKVSTLKKSKIHLFTKKKPIPEISLDIGDALFEMVSSGLAIEVSKVVETRKLVKIPFYYKVGKYFDMDEMQEQIKMKSKRVGYLYLQKKTLTWTIEMEN